MNGFVFDENIPRQTTLIPSLPVILTTDLGSSISDSDVWAYAREHALAIITKDSDFSNGLAFAILALLWVLTCLSPLTSRHGRASTSA